MALLDSPVSFSQNIREVFLETCQIRRKDHYLSLLQACEIRLDHSRSEIRGLCTSFAPENDITRRDRVLSEKFEKGSFTNFRGTLVQMEPIKYYSRSAAGNVQQATEILSPETLHRCLAYIHDILVYFSGQLNELGSKNADDKSDFFTFLDNRLRAVGKDYESQSIAGDTHMADMAMIFRIYIFRMLECTRTDADCRNFSSFKKLNNERMDAVQGNLLKYTFHPKNASLFNELFTFFLLRCLGHDAELDARHWWTDILSTRRQMLFKLSTSPFAATMDPTMMLWVLHGVHFIETGQWTLYCQLIKMHIEYRLHAVLLTSALSYIRIRALIEMWDGSSLESQKVRYTGSLSTEWLSRILLFDHVEALCHFSGLLSIRAHINYSTMRCGLQTNRKVFFAKRIKESILRPVKMLYGDNGVQNVHTLAELHSQVTHESPGSGSCAMQALLDMITFKLFQDQMEFNEANQQYLPSENSPKNISVNEQATCCSDIPRAFLSEASTKPPSSQAKVKNCNFSISFQNFVNFGHERISSHMLFENLDTLLESRANFAKRSRPLCSDHSKKITDVALVQRISNHFPVMPKWFEEACKLLFRTSLFIHSSVRWTWNIAPSDDFNAYEISRLFGHSGYLSDVNAGNSLEIFHVERDALVGIEANPSQYACIMTFISFFTEKSCAEEKIAFIRRVTAQKPFKLVQVVFFAKDMDTMALANEFLINQPYQTGIEIDVWLCAVKDRNDMLGKRSVLEYALCAVCASAAKLVS